MTESDKVFAGSIPETYDAYLVPMIFEEYAEDLAERVADLNPRHILETAAGSGVVARALAARLGPRAHYAVTDLNQPMLDHAANRQGHDLRITWQQADALDLPFEDETFDVVVCQFGVMFFPDKVTGYKEAWRVLRSGGCFLFNVWDHIGVNEFADAVTKAAASVFPEDPPLFMARIPHGYHDTEFIRRELKNAGYTKVSVSTVEKASPSPSPRHAALAYCQGTPLRNEIEARDKTKLELVTNYAAEAIAEQWGSGPISAKIRAHIFTAEK